ncbi:MAG TPA: SCO1860 family LAETG-anchored protein [Streptomyces sp.]
MNSNTFRLAALAAVAGPVALLAAVPAQANTATAPATRHHDGGKASAVVLRTALEVSLLHHSAHVPLNATLNEVQAPASAEKTALSVRLDGVERGREVRVLRADVATAEATADRHRARGYSNLVKARVHVPGLPLLSLIEVEKATSKAYCEAGKRPVAESNVLGHVSVLGKRVRLSAGGTTRVAVPGVGVVTLDLSKTATTSRTAAATALRLGVYVKPLDLNVARVKGEVTLAEATCETPRSRHDRDTGSDTGSDAGTNGGTEQGGSDGSGTDTGGSADQGTTGTSTGAGDKGTAGTATGDQGATGTDVSDKGSAADKGDSGVKAQSGTDAARSGAKDNLAETGSSSTTPYIAGGAALLLAAGAGVTVLARKRARGADRG